MFKEKLLKMAAEKREQLKKLNDALINSDDKEERMALGKTLDSVKNELEELERLIADIDEPADDKGGKGKPDTVIVDDDVLVDDKRGLNVAATMEMRNGKPADDAEKRAQAFAKSERMSIPAKEARSVLIASGGIAKPDTVGGINDPFNVISSVVDLVRVEDMTGMGSHKEAYVKAWQTADAGTDGTAPTPSDPTFGMVQFNPFTLEVMTFISKDIRKQTPLQYEAKVREGALIALKKKLASWIVAGNGSSQIYGIVNAVNTDSESMVETLEIAGNIDDKTLRTIVFNYGGDENIGSNATLILNKKDLIAFGDVRGDDKKPVYEITPDGSNPNRGTIRDAGLVVPYVICSSATAFTGAGTSAKTMMYGDIKGYLLGLFGNYEVNVSDDYKFGEGLLTVRGEVMVGGNVNQDKGFVVVTTPATKTTTKS